MHRLRALAGGLLDLVLPPGCAACGAGTDGAVLCPACDRALVRAPSVAAPAGLEACAAGALYAAASERFVRRFKYPRRGIAGLDPAAGAVARALVCEAARRAPGRPPDLVVAVPLHPRRLRQRGFNPAALLARAAAREAGAPCDPVALVRVRDTQSQTGLDRRARERNVRGAFAPAAGRRLPERVWIVDDVVTTGATLAEAARALARGGAREIVGVCAAQTP